MRWIDSWNHNIFSIFLSCLREHNFFLNEKEWLILQKKRSLFYEVQIEFFFLFVTKSTMDQFPFYLGVLNTPIILSFMLLLPRDMSEQGHPH